MKILHVVTGLRKASGVTTFVENVVRVMRAAGDAVDVCTERDSALLSGCLAYDVVHIHGLWSPFLHRASMCARRKGIPVVWSTHGMTAPWSMRHKWWKKCLPWYIYQRRDLASAALVHCTVEMEARWNAALGLTRCLVVPLGTERVPVSGWHERKERVILFVGRVYPVKALDRLIESFARAIRLSLAVPAAEADSRLFWRLRIVGPDQAGHMAELMALCERLGLSYSDTAATLHGGCPARVEFVGPKFDADLGAEYDACDALALVSHTENFGATVVDAMSRGKVVITSTSTPWQEVATRGCGWWVDNDLDALTHSLCEMMSLPDVVRREMGLRGRKLVEEKYTWKAVCRALVEGYRKVVASRQ